MSFLRNIKRILFFTSIVLIFVFSMQASSSAYIVYTESSYVPQVATEQKIIDHLTATFEKKLSIDNALKYISSTKKKHTTRPKPVIVFDEQNGTCYPTYAKHDWISQDILCYTLQIARDFSIDPVQFARVAWCESRFKPTAKNSSSSASGVFQFLTSTWNYVASHTGYNDVFNFYHNIYNAGWLWANDSPRHWVCY